MSKKSGKITLSMLKGKPITTSVPTFAFRFNAEDEELEELYTSPVEEPEQEASDVQDEQNSSSSRCSTPHNVASASRDSSPMKEHLQKLTKRSSSLEESPSSSDTWRLLHELKGKITKTVEEKLSEIKSEKRREHPKLASSKDNSSISDSEECISIEKTPMDDGSPVPATPESTTPEPETPRLEISPPTNAETSPHRSFFKAAEASFKNRIRPKLSELRQRRKKTGNFEDSVALSGIPDESVDEYEVLGEEAVEPAVEVEEVIPGKKSAPAAVAMSRGAAQSWSFPGHLRHLCKQREVQALLVWPLLCLLLPVPSVVRDVVLGALLMHTLHCAYRWLMEPGPSALEKPLQLPDYTSLPILQVPAVREYQPLQRYEGWMNELQDDYDPETYNINQTRSVYLRLEGSLLRLNLTRQKVRKRAMWNEPPPRLSFHHQRIFDIAGCPIKLLPEGLARKRLWSKKYPICVILRQDSRVGFSMPETFKDVIDDNEEEDEGQDENSEDDAFCVVTSSMVEQNQLFLFARTDREKDDWVRRLVAATKVCPSPESSEPLTPSQDQDETEPEPAATPEPPVASPEMELHRHISRFLQKVQKRWARQTPPLTIPQSVTSPTIDEGQDNGSPVKTPSEGGQKEPDTAWFNALLSRVLFDVLRDPQWSEWVRDRIQRKLATIKLPTFMEELTVSELDLGVAPPVVHRVSAPHMDERGLWVDLDVSYEGSASISVETKLNLVKLTKGDSVESSSSSNRDAPTDPKTLSRSPMYDSDLEDSAESSSDEDTQDASADDSAPAGGSGGSMGKMLFRMATKITTSRYFQQASEIRYIRRAMEEMSNTRVMVNVELKGLVGVLALNIPPLPSDRLWYGFRGNPELRLAAKAKLGERLVTLSQVTDWIEGKLCLEFQKVFVLPNMDELIIPVMNSKLPK